MRLFFFSLVVFSLSLSCSAQRKGSIQLYGFEQTVSGGKAPEINDRGLRVSEGGGKNYFLYAVSPGRIYPVEVWIHGTRYGTTMKTIAETPVEYGDEQNIGSPKKLLVPKTTRKVLQIIPAADTGSKIAGTRIKTTAKNNALVLVYQMAGKFYYQVLPRLSKIDGAAMQ